MGSKDNLEEAREELKRADHLIFVSLKYTRTVDVIRSVIERLIASLNFMIDALLELAKEGGLIDSMPQNNGLKCSVLRAEFKHPEIADMLSFYTLLRKISRADYRKREEYRRHVTMTAVTEDGPVDISIDVIKEYYEKALSFAEFISQLISPVENPQ
ncbi:hypothetical protein COT48_04995 [Candidatus Woesearchaeota archaeon CG08_land_8_20_14_0_20_47_9]|nr:MAG: hypothetical protein AUJ69_04290 [Candidatus Woesearchaeota archaeon CG1_02_47_18]PIN72654.1 MAG: hypothetical protein COV22_02670 [Candidatus Woesearchaeota archaeon CG10_big_fil_rev_8_21_14_0_10_47_5]PIO03408.1 MAG: hypothetical protein COT48_04995 [Candidatus Woesearchaeota archaeon CG08_land_8_20_14_0_20_47_9]HII29602.1 hypothetical protein [Candidatus Woesearchaeota archaeon]